MMNAVMGMAMVNITQDHHILLRVDKRFQASMVLYLGKDDMDFTRITSRKQATFDRIMMRLNRLSMKSIFGRIVQRRIAHATDGTGSIQREYQPMMGACIDGSFLAGRMGRCHLYLRDL